MAAHSMRNEALTHTKMRKGRKKKRTAVIKLLLYSYHFIALFNEICNFIMRCLIKYVILFYIYTVYIY